MRMESLKKEGRYIKREIEKLINQLEENDKKENRDEREKRRIEHQKKKLEIRGQKIEESKKELSKRQNEIKNKSKREKHQINIAEPDARMMKELNANGYNIQLSVDAETEMIVNASPQADRSDYHQFSKQHEGTEKILGEDKQREYLADGGYMSTETLDYLEDKKVNAYVNDSREIEKIPEVKKLLKRSKLITSEFFTYNKGNNEYICPDQRVLKEIKPGIYKSDDCSGCIIKHLCARKNKSRRITRTEFTGRKELMRKKIKQKPEKMNQRKAIERVFGNIKWNLGFRRFSRKGFEGATIEIVLIALALNLKKIGQLGLFSKNPIQTILNFIFHLLLKFKITDKLCLQKNY